MPGGKNKIEGYRIVKDTFLELFNEEYAQFAGDNVTGNMGADTYFIEPESDDEVLSVGWVLRPNGGFRITPRVRPTLIEGGETTGVTHDYNPNDLLDKIVDYSIWLVENNVRRLPEDKQHELLSHGEWQIRAKADTPTT